MSVAGLRFRIEVETSDTVPDAKARAEKLAPAFRGPVDAIVTEMENEQWASKGGLSPRAWAPLSPMTRFLRTHEIDGGKRRGGNRGGLDHPLWDFGRLRASLTKSGGPDSIRTISDREYVRGTRVPYARQHQKGWTMRSMYGSPVPHRFVLPRQVIPDPVPVQYLGRIEAVLANYIVAGDLDEHHGPHLPEVMRPEAA